MTTPQTFVIAGASLAGAKAAETLRSEGFDGRVVLIGEEPVRPYERPPLSKAYLRGEVDFDSAAVHSEDFYQEHDIELLTSTTVLSIDPQTRRIEMDPGGSLAYDQLLLTTGATPRRVTIPGAQLAGIHYLRSLSSCDSLRDAIARATRVVVVGAGWIGSEVAASARQLGKEVALIEAGQVPLERVLGAEVGTLFRDLHAEKWGGSPYGFGRRSLPRLDRGRGGRSGRWRGGRRRPLRGRSRYQSQDRAGRSGRPLPRQRRRGRSAPGHGYTGHLGCRRRGQRLPPRL